jgi:hypothetical protein
LYHEKYSEPSLSTFSATTRYSDGPTQFTLSITPIDLSEFQKYGRCSAITEVQIEPSLLARNW